jgi:hypothetical protein
VDDFLLFSNNKNELNEWRMAMIKNLAEFRLTLHEDRAQLRPVSEGTPFLGFQIFPEHRKIKRRKGIAFQRKYKKSIDKYKNGNLSQEQIAASVRGWVNHASYADTWGLRCTILNFIS